MINKEQLEKIDAYFRGGLTEVEEQELLDEVNKNEELKTEFNLRKVEHESIELLIEDDLRENFKNWDKEDNDQNEKTTKIKSIKRFILPISIAASFLLILGFFVVQSGKYTNEVLADSYYEPDYSGLRSIDGGDANVFANVENILQNKISERYLDLEKALQNIPVQNPNYFLGQYYLGHLYLEQDKFSDAVAAFENAIPNDVIKNDAEWFKAIGLLHNDEISNAEILLNSIAGDTEHDYVIKAQNLLKDLDSFWRNFRT